METPPACPKQPCKGSLSKLSLTPCRRLGLCRPSTSSLKKSLLASVASPLGSDVSKLVSVDKVKVPEFETPVERTLQPNCDVRINVPLKLSEAQSKESNVCKLKVRRCLTVNGKTPSKVNGNPDSLRDISVTSDQCSNKLNCSETITQRCRKRKRRENDKVLTSTTQANYPSLVHDEDHSVALLEHESESNDSVEEVALEIIEKLVKSIQEKKKKVEELKVQDTYAKKHNLEELRALSDKWKKAGQEALQYSVDLAKEAGYSVTIKQLMKQHDFPQHLMGYNSEDDEFA